MNPSLNLIQDLDFTEVVATPSAQTVVGGLTIRCLPIDGIDVGGCFPTPRPLPHPRPFPICELPLPKPRPYPWPGPKHPPIELYAVS
jgi:hypothetical protein